MADGWLPSRPCATTHQLRKSTGPVRLRPNSKPRREDRRRPGSPTRVTLAPELGLRISSNYPPRLPLHNSVGGEHGKHINVGWLLLAGIFSLDRFGKGRGVGLEE